MVLTAKNPRPFLAILVGITAGLQTAQVAGVHLYCVAIALWLALGVARRPRPRLRLGPPTLVLGCTVLLAATAFTGELVNSRLVAVQLLLLAGTSAGVILFADSDDTRCMLRGLLITTTMACLAGLLQYVGLLPYEVYLGTTRPIGLYSEPDWLGMFSAVGLVIVFLTGIGRYRVPLMLLHTVILLLAAARAAWLAVLVVAVAGYLVAKLSQRRQEEGAPRGGWRLVGLGLLLVTVVIAASPTLQDSLQARVLGTVAARPDVAALARQQQNASLLELEAKAPWYGLGLSASGRVGVSGRIDYIGRADNNVASNWVLGWWVDGGLLGLPLILLFAGAAVTRLTTPSGLVLATVLVCSFFSNALLIPIAWIGLALCLSRTDQSEVSTPVAERRYGVG